MFCVNQFSQVLVMADPYADWSDGLHSVFLETTPVQGSLARPPTHEVKIFECDGIEWVAAAETGTGFDGWVLSWSNRGWIGNVCWPT